MQRLVKPVAFMAAAAAVVLLVLLQWSWQLKDAHYLQHVAQQTDSYHRLAQALPDYASSKLPEPEEAKQIFAKQVTVSNIKATVDPLLVSAVDAYHGKTDTVTADLSPVLVPVSASGYSIPPGTVFARSNITVEGAAPLLRTMQRCLWPTLVATMLLVGLLVLIGMRQGTIKSIRLLLLFMAIILVGLFAASMVLPSLIDTLIATANFDTMLKNIVVDIVRYMASDAGRYYLVLAILCFAAWLLLLTVHSVGRLKQRRDHQHKKVVSTPASKDW